MHISALQTRSSDSGQCQKVDLSGWGTSNAPRKKAVMQISEDRIYNLWQRQKNIQIGTLECHRWHEDSAKRWAFLDVCKEIYVWASIRTIKSALNQSYLLLKGFRKVGEGGKTCLTMLAYNLRRVLNMMRTKQRVIAVTPTKQKQDSNNAKSRFLVPFFTESLRNLAKL